MPAAIVVQYGSGSETQQVSGPEKSHCWKAGEKATNKRSIRPRKLDYNGQR